MPFTVRFCVVELREAVDAVAIVGSVTGPFLSYALAAEYATHMRTVYPEHDYNVMELTATKITRMA